MKPILRFCVVFALMLTGTVMLAPQIANAQGLITDCTNQQTGYPCMTATMQAGSCESGVCVGTSAQCGPGLLEDTEPCEMADGQWGSCVNGVCQGEIADGTCTSSSTYDIAYPEDGEEGIVTGIINNIKSVLQTVSRTMFNAIKSNRGFVNAVTAAATIFVIIYGIFFTFGMVQLTLSELFIRLIKIGVIVMLLSPDAWYWFDRIFVQFFSDGTDALIERTSAIAINATDTGGDVFTVLDHAIVQLVSAKMAIHLLAAFAAGPYGPIIGILLLMSLGSFFKAILNALWVYLMALVMRTLLFGVAPLFIVCLLFSRTRHLFDGWLNQVINSCLQPIMLFMFFAFFCQLIRSCVEQLLALDVCWTAWAELMRGTPFVGHYWRFAIWQCRSGGDCVCDPALNNCILVPFSGEWGWNGPEGTGDNADTRIHPVGIMLPLTMWLLADLAGRFNHLVLDIAKDLSNASTNLAMGGGSIKEWFTGRGRSGGGGSGTGGGTPQAPGPAGGVRPQLGTASLPINIPGLSGPQAPRPPSP